MPPLPNLKTKDNAEKSKNEEKKKNYPIKGEYKNKRLIRQVKNKFLKNRSFKMDTHF